ncbi:MAG: S1C family serine protease [Gemmataceae bacterium]
MYAALMMAGLALAAPNDAERGFLGVQLSNENGTIEIHDTFPDSPAAKAGLKSGDVIVKVDGKDAGELMAFVEMVGKKKPGDKVKLTVKRDGKEKEIEVTLGKAPPKEDKD